MAESKFSRAGPSLATGGSSTDMDFLAAISPPVLNQPQVFTDAMLDPISAGVMDSLPIKHMSAATLQRTLRHSADELLHAVEGQFDSLKGNMSYKELLAGLTYDGEIFQATNRFKFMNYKYLQFCDENGNLQSQRTSGICLLTNKRMLFLSSQITVGTSLVEWGSAKKLPGGYLVESSCNDTTYYLPVPLRCLKSIQMCGKTGVRGQLLVHGVAPCCCGLCGWCGLNFCPNSNMLKQWMPQPITHTQVKEMKVSVGVLMPPWERKMFLNIYIEPSVPLPVTRDFVSLLQKNSPELN